MPRADQQRVDEEDIRKVERDIERQREATEGEIQRVEKDTEPVEGEESEKNE